MSSDKDRYKENSLRVREIYGIGATDRRFNIHHIIQKSDYGTKKQKKFWDSSVPSGRFDIDAVSNLFPLKVEVHADLHRRLDGLDPLPEKKPKRLPIKRRRRGKRRR